MYMTYCMCTLYSTPSLHDCTCRGGTDSILHVYNYTYTLDSFITRPVLKPSDSFKLGVTALNPAGRLDIQPGGFKAGLMAS